MLNLNKIQNLSHDIEQLSNCSFTLITVTETDFNSSRLFTPSGKVVIAILDEESLSCFPNRVTFLMKFFDSNKKHVSSPVSINY